MSLNFRKYLLLLLSLTLLGSGKSLGDGEICNKPYILWNEEDVLQVLNQSPWSKQMTLTQQRMDVASSGSGDREGRDPRTVADDPRGFGMSKSSGISGEKEIYHHYDVRLFSALPVRQAYVRQIQIASNYSQLPPRSRLAIDARTAPALTLDTSKEIVVSLEFSSNDRQMAMEIDRQLKTVGREQLKQSVYLISEHFNRVEIQDYIKPTSDGTGAKFVFPRTIHGEPIIGIQDQEFAFELFVPGVGHKVYVTWNVQELSCQGQLQF